MKLLERTIYASTDNKILYLTVNGIKIGVPWKDSRYYIGEKVRVAIQKVNEQKAFSVFPIDKRLPWEEKHWKEEAQINGISGSIEG